MYRPLCSIDIILPPAPIKAFALAVASAMQHLSERGWDVTLEEDAVYLAYGDSPNQVGGGFAYGEAVDTSRIHIYVWVDFKPESLSCADIEQSVNEYVRRVDRSVLAPSRPGHIEKWQPSLRSMNVSAIAAALGVATGILIIAAAGK